MEDLGMPSDPSRPLAEALGRVVQNAATLESQLRTLAAALIGSKYAAVVVAGQSTSSLVEMIDAISKVHDQITLENLEELRQLLSRTKSASKRRNDFAHGLWAIGADGAVTAHNSRYRQIDWTKTPVSHYALTDLASELSSCATGVSSWTYAALPPGAISNEAQLRWEAYVRSLSPAELESMIRRRSQANE